MAISKNRTSAGRSIHTLHWGVIPHDLAHSWRIAQSTLLAIWPAPHNADYCLHQAGFTDFNDPDDAWDAEWRDIVSRAVDQLAALGKPRIRNRIEVFDYQAKSTPKLLDLSIVERLVTVSEDGRFPDAIVDFDAKVPISLRTSNGHAMLWLTLSNYASLDQDVFLTTLADGRPLERMDLAWNHLVNETKR